MLTARKTKLSRPASFWQRRVTGYDPVVDTQKVYRCADAIDFIKKRWDTFCTEVLDCDPHDELLRLDISRIHPFFEWLVENSRIAYASTLQTRWNTFQMLYRQESGDVHFPIELKLQMVSVRARITSQYGLETRKREKGIARVEEQFELLRTLWESPDVKFNHERQRVQFALILHLAGLSGQRPQALVNVRYGDIAVELIRESNTPRDSPPRVVVKFTFAYTKSFLGEKDANQFAVLARNQILQHQNGHVYQHNYLSRHIGQDTNAIYQGLQPQVQLMRTATGMTRTIDTRRPRALTDQQHAEIESHTETKRLVTHRKNLMQSIKQRYGTLAKAKGTSLHAQHAEAVSACCKHKRLLRAEKLNTARKQFTRKQAVADIRYQLQTSEASASPTDSAQLSPPLSHARQRAFSAVFAFATSAQQTLYAEEVKRRCEAINALAALCAVQEPAVRRACRPRNVAASSVPEASVALKLSMRAEQPASNAFCVCFRAIPAYRLTSLDLHYEHIRLAEQFASFQNSIIGSRLEVIRPTSSIVPLYGRTFCGCKVARTAYSMCTVCGGRTERSTQNTLTVHVRESKLMFCVRMFSTPDLPPDGENGPWDRQSSEEEAEEEEAGSMNEQYELQLYYAIVCDDAVIASTVRTGHSSNDVDVFQKGFESWIYQESGRLGIQKYDILRTETIATTEQHPTYHEGSASREAVRRALNRRLVREQVLGVKEDVRVKNQFYKRNMGLRKKAHELAMLCKVQC
ncbi:uncharacterized protein MYCFIDRAFT_214924 [Pseudocercospora fijiensis CIRAD86]|uniref:MADS-box domain-containing protein n=1 Tax=Pseudocercospora fijiensis (strain CIRAD86) TaxID=383855 RepID=M3A1H8_PSEFD|nr:uncharacterized protein MYCFIDRAFT_214924 [Pseudocercospora fijiensis CIRAD86]EME85029.1 hypothetical protein MYCFIDRAFT_214924 [Pseudocercospora fijiensis CIRAD86]